MDQFLEAHVRRATHGDIASLVTLGLTIQELHSQALPTVFVEPDEEAFASFFRDALESDDHVLVVDNGKELLGYLLAAHVARGTTSFKHASSLLHIHHIVVAPKARREQLGARLMKAAAELAKDIGATAIRLDSWSFNVDAQNFFVSQGFAPINVVFERPLEEGLRDSN